MEALAFWPESGMPLYVPGPDDPPETVFVAKRASDGARFAVRVTLARVVGSDLFHLRFEKVRFAFAPVEVFGNVLNAVSWLPMATHPGATLDAYECRFLGEHAAHWLNGQLDQQEREDKEDDAA